MTESGDFAIGDLARQTHCNIETIRYYERIGLLPVPRRRGRYRSYSAKDIAPLAFVKRARELGFPLDDVRALLNLATTTPPSCKKARDLAAAHLSDIRARIADLRRMDRILAATVRQCDSGNSHHCPLIDSLVRV